MRAGVCCYALQLCYDQEGKPVAKILLGCTKSFFKFAGDTENARKLFQQSLTQAKVVGMQQGTSNAQAALESLENTDSVES